MTNSLNEYKLDDQTCKLVKEAKKENFPQSGKIESKNTATNNFAMASTLRSLPQPPLETYSTLPEE